jgi:hypothetical protein
MSICTSSGEHSFRQVRPKAWPNGNHIMDQGGNASGFMVFRGAGRNQLAREAL